MQILRIWVYANCFPLFTPFFSLFNITTAYLEYAPQILNELWMEWYADNVNANQKHGFDWVDQDAQGYPVICGLSICGSDPG